MNSQTPAAVLFLEGFSNYGISVSDKPSLNERAAEQILIKYFREAGGVNLQQGENSFYIRLLDLDSGMPQSGYRIRSEGKNLIIEGNKKGVIYGAYHFIERFLGCRKFAPGEKAFCPGLQNLSIPLPLDISESPAFGFREVYSLAETDAEYLDWHKLHSLEELWGIWGHSFNKLVPMALFKTNPEYFAYYNGRRHPTQLCLSNDQVFEITSRTLEENFLASPLSRYWSVSPNDNNGFCECRLCREADRKDGGKQGSLLNFVNRIARRYPDKTFTTLAYNDTVKPPTITVPEKNVTVFLSNVDIYRTVAVQEEPTASRFRKHLRDWTSITDRIIIWDYYTQFTNFLAPFPVENTFKPNLGYYQKEGVFGIFAQLQGPTYGEFSELKTYLLAKLMWNPNADQEKLTDDFLKGYYKEAAPQLKDYLYLRQRSTLEPGTRLDIYGNPINNVNDYLSPAYLTASNSILDEAELWADEETLPRLKKLRLPLEYTLLQQAKLFGLRQQSTYLEKEARWAISEGFRNRINRFRDNALTAGVKVLSEEGLSPMEYADEWEEIFQDGVTHNQAQNTLVTLKYPHASEYPAKKEATLTDGIPGYHDYSYNWLLFYGKPMVATVDLGKLTAVSQIEMDFLEDQRYWIVRPRKVKLQYSSDGKRFKTIDSQNLDEPTESYGAIKIRTSFRNLKINARYLRITAENQKNLPSYLPNRSKKPMIACDEIWVQ